MTYRQGHGPVSIAAPYLPNHFISSAVLQTHQVEPKELHCAGCMASLNEGQFIYIFFV